MAYKGYYQDIYFDIDKSISEIFKATQGDTKSRGYYVTILQRGKKKDITQDTLVFYAEKPDKTRVVTNGIKDGDKFRIDLKNQVFAVPGKVECQLALKGSGGESLAIAPFGIIVNESLEDSSIVSKDERGILDKAFDMAEGLLPRLELIDVELLENYQARIAEVETGLAQHKLDYDEQFSNIDFINLSNNLENFLDTGYMVTNLLENGDFHNDTNEWIVAGGTLETDNNKAILRGSGVSANPYIYSETKHNAVVGNKIYVRTTITALESLNSFRMRLSGSGSSEVLQVVISSPTLNEPTTASNVFDIGNQSGFLRVWGFTSYGSATVAKDSRIVMEKFITIDLTKEFGKGNEPTKDKMDEFINNLPNQYFDDRASLISLKELFDTMSEKLDAIANNKPLATPKTSLSLDVFTIENDLIPSSIGADGYVYFMGGVSERTIYRSNDSLATIEEGSTFSTPSGRIKYVTKTHAGYVVVMGTAGGLAGRIYFSESFDSGFTEVLLGDLPFTTMSTGFYNQGSALEDIGLVGEYVSNNPNVVHKLYLTKDGGRTWKHTLSTTIVDDSVSAHWHCCGYDQYSGRLFASCGDGDNRNLFLSDDMGDTWKAIKNFKADNIDLNKGHLFQPTLIIPTAERLSMSPDSTTVAGIMSLMRDKNYTSPTSEEWLLKWEHSIVPELAAYQFGVSPYVISNKAIYVLCPQSGSGNKKNFIVASGDGGNSWHNVYVSNLEGVAQMNYGVVGTDINGYIYSRVINNGVKYIIRAKELEWISST